MPAETVHDWRELAACRDGDPELHFPIGSTGPALLQIEAAKAVCHGCPVQEACLAYALRNNLRHGIWGGLTEEQRDALKRREARARSKARAAS